MEGNVRLLAFHPAGNEGVFLVKRKTSSGRDCRNGAHYFVAVFPPPPSGNEKISRIISRASEWHIFTRAVRRESQTACQMITRINSRERAFR